MTGKQQSNPWVQCHRNPWLRLKIAVMPNSNSPSLVLDKQEAKTKPPPMYRVVLLNDDYTPMDFVILVLQKRAKGSVDFSRAILRPPRSNKFVVLQGSINTRCSA
jgi:hypothetical protein